MGSFCRKKKRSPSWSIFVNRMDYHSSFLRAYPDLCESVFFLIKDSTFFEKNIYFPKLSYSWFMIKESDLKSLRNAIVAAENSIRTAKHLLTELLGGDVKNNFDASTQGLSAYNEDGATVVE